MLVRAARTIVAKQSAFATRTVFSSQIRMSSSTPKREWLVHVPDFPGALDKRMAVRATHLTNVKPDVEEGKIVLGGALLAKQPEDGQTPDMIGSAFIIRADTVEEVKEWLAKDIYTTGGAWDIAKAEIYPFRSAVRTAL